MRINDMIYYRKAGLSGFFYTSKITNILEGNLNLWFHRDSKLPIGRNEEFPQ